MSTSAAPPMLPSPAAPEAMPPEGGDMGAEDQQAVLMVAAVADEVVTAALKDPTVVKRIFEVAIADPEILAMIQQTIGGGAPGDEEPSGSFEDDLEALVSESDDLVEITDDDLAMMAE